MRALVVYESMWGNSRAIAQAIAEALGTESQLVGVQDAPTRLPDDVDLVVVGGPTHAFSMSRKTTRQDAAKKGAPTGDGDRGIREWLAELPPSDRIAMATFDTRVAKVKRLPGSAAKSAAKEVRHHHLGRLVGTESFYVDDMEGPLLPGEVQRAAAWAAHLRNAAP